MPVAHRIRPVENWEELVAVDPLARDIDAILKSSLRAKQQTNRE